MPIDHVEFLRSEAAALAAAARRGPLDAAVPACPGWDVRALVGHVGRVHRWAKAAAGSPTAPDTSTLPRPPQDEIIEWFEAGAAALADHLGALGPDTPSWNFAGAEPATARFWSRRQAIETAIHRWDAEAAVGDAAPIDPVLAADGIDELLHVGVPFRYGSHDGIDIGGSVHLHCADTDGEWTLRTDDGVVRVTRGHVKGDVALRGPASPMLLALAHRVPPTAAGLEVLGDPTVLDRWLALGPLP